MMPILDPQTGVVIAHIPLPKDWEIKDNSVIGPNGVKTADYPNNFFDFQQRRPIPLEQVVREDLAPAIYQAGGKILGTFVIPEMENYDRAYNNLLWKFGNPTQDFNALGVDCESPDGNRSLLILWQMISQSQYHGNWGYYINAMEANTSANQAAFDARNQAWMESSNAISEMSIKGWRSRFDANSAGQSATIDSINEEETIYDSVSGQNMQVEAGSKRYYTTSIVRVSPATTKLM